MAWFNRSNGLIGGGLVAAGCIVAVIAECFHRDSYLWIPIVALAFWGGTSLHQLLEENDRRARILRKMGVSEIDELAKG